VLELRIDVKDAAGNKQGEIVDFWALDMQDEPITIGTMYVDLSPSHPIIPFLVQRGIIELWMRNETVGLAWSLAFRGLFVGFAQGYYPPFATETYKMIVVSPMWLLAQRVIAYKSGINSPAQISLFTNTAAETICHKLVKFNIGLSATTGNGRFINGNLPNIYFGTDYGRGPLLNWDCTQENLLELIKILAAKADAQFNLDYSSGGNFTFNWYPVSIGTDRSSIILFSLQAGNMNEPVYTYDRTNGKAAVFVAGDGKLAAQIFSTSLASDYLLGSNDSEICVQSPNKTDVTGMQHIGDGTIALLRNRPVFEFQAQDNPVTVFGRDYFLGDLVSGVYIGVKQVYKVKQVSIKSQRDRLPVLSITLSL